MPVLRFLAFAARHGLIRIPKIQHVATFGDGATLDVPGAPVAIHLPGHTPGSAALLSRATTPCSWAMRSSPTR